MRHARPFRHAESRFRPALARRTPRRRGRGGWRTVVRRLPELAVVEPGRRSSRSSTPASWPTSGSSPTTGPTCCRWPTPGSGATCSSTGRSRAGWSGRWRSGARVCVTVTVARRDRPRPLGVQHLDELPVGDGDGRDRGGHRPAERAPSVFEALLERLVPGRYADVRAPNPSELRQTLVARLPIDVWSAKVSAGPPDDDADDLSFPVWAGEIPLRLVADASRRRARTRRAPARGRARRRGRRARDPGRAGERRAPLPDHPTVVIPFDELEWRVDTSGGPGGQHANVTRSRVEVRFDVAASRALGTAPRSWSLERLGPGRCAAAASDARSQARNRELALERLRAAPRRPRSASTAPPPDQAVGRRRQQAGRATKRRRRREARPPPTPRRRVTQTTRPATPRRRDAAIERAAERPRRRAGEVARPSRRCRRAWRPASTGIFARCAGRRPSRGSRARRTPIVTTSTPTSVSAIAPRLADDPDAERRGRRRRAPPPTATPVASGTTGLWSWKRSSTSMQQRQQPRAGEQSAASGRARGVASRRAPRRSTRARPRPSRRGPSDPQAAVRERRHRARSADRSAPTRGGRGRSGFTSDERATPSGTYTQTSDGDRRAGRTVATVRRMCSAQRSRSLTTGVAHRSGRVRRLPKAPRRARGARSSPDAACWLDVLLFAAGALLVAWVLDAAVRTFVLPRGSVVRLHPDRVPRACARVFDLPLHFAKTYEQRDRVMALYAPLSLLILPAVVARARAQRLHAHVPRRRRRRLRRRVPDQRLVALHARVPRAARPPRRRARVHRGRDRPRACSRC